MKILYSITKGNWGGAQRYVFDLACAAQDQGHEVVVVLGEGHELQRRLEERRIRVITLPELSRNISLAADWRSFKAFKALLTREHPDLVHLNSSKMGGMGALASRMCGVRNIIFTAHGWAFNEDRPQLQKLIIGILHWFTMLFSTKTIVVSEAMRMQVRAFPFVQKKIAVIHNGIMPPAFLSRSEAREKLFPKNNFETLIGTIAELHPTKRIEDAIEAFAQLASEFPNAAYVVVGEGEQRSQLQHLIKEKKLESRVFLLGHIQQAAAYLHALDLFILPSRSEGLAYVLIEAGFAGLPVVATAVGGIPEVIESGVSGLLVSPERPSELASAMRQLLKDAALKERYGRTLLERVQQNFSLQEMVRETLSVYQS